MTNITLGYEYYGIVENEKGEPVAEFRHSEPDFIERRLCLTRNGLPLFS